MPATLEQAATPLCNHPRRPVAPPLSASLEDRPFGRIAFDLGELRRVISVRAEHVIKGHHRRGAVVALQESVVKEVIAGATEAAIAKPARPPSTIRYIGQQAASCHKLPSVHLAKQGQLTRCAPEPARAWSARTPPSCGPGAARRRGTRTSA